MNQVEPILKPDFVAEDEFLSTVFDKARQWYLERLETLEKVDQSRMLLFIDEAKENVNQRFMDKQALDEKIETEKKLTGELLQKQREIEQVWKDNQEKEAQIQKMSYSQKLLKSAYPDAVLPLFESLGKIWDEKKFRMDVLHGFLAHLSLFQMSGTTKDDVDEVDRYIYKGEGEICSLLRSEFQKFLKDISSPFSIKWPEIGGAFEDDWQERVENNGQLKVVRVLRDAVLENGKVVKKAKVETGAGA